MGEVPLYASAFNAPCEKCWGGGGSDPGQREFEFARAGCVGVQGYLAHKTTTPPKDHHRTLDRGPLQGPRGGGFL